MTASGAPGGERVRDELVETVVLTDGYPDDDGVTWNQARVAIAVVLPLLTAADVPQVREEIAKKIEVQAPTADGFGKDSYGRNLALLLREHWASAARIARGES